MILNVLVNSLHKVGLTVFAKPSDGLFGLLKTRCKDMKEHVS